jgi:hypothetical protein
MKDGGVVDRHATFPHKFFHVALAQGVPQIPPHGAEDDLGFKMAPFEQGEIAHGQSPVI